MEFEVLKYIAIIAGFYMAWNIGANDVANAVSTSVGSKAISLKKAVFAAAILEFAGAFLLGGKVSTTIQSGIVTPTMFTHDPIIYILGMLGALIATGAWLNLASYFKLPVSTTHAIVGAVFGFGVVLGGVQAIQWTNISIIALSWILTPFASGLIAFLIFRILQHKVLFALNPLRATKKIIPYLAFLTFASFSFSLFLGALELSLSKSLLFSSSIGFATAIIAHFLLKKIKTFAEVKYDHHPQQVITLEKAAKHLLRLEDSSFGETKQKASKILDEVNSLLTKVRYKTEFVTTSTEYTQVEKIFGYLQICSMCLVAFAHGTNDVANAIGPVAAVLQSLQTKNIAVQTTVSKLLLFFGGVGIVIGVATWGWRVIETIAHKITELTPTRGFSAEFSAAIIILLASKLGLPISTTHALVGGILGVGIAKGFSALNLKTIKDIISSWIITIPICAVFSIIFFYVLKIFFH